MALYRPYLEHKSLLLNINHGACRRTFNLQLKWTFAWRSLNDHSVIWALGAALHPLRHPVTRHYALSSFVQPNSTFYLDTIHGPLGRRQRTFKMHTPLWWAHCGKVYLHCLLNRYLFKKKTLSSWTSKFRSRDAYFVRPEWNLYPFYSFRMCLSPSCIFPEEQKPFYIDTIKKQIRYKK